MIDPRTFARELTAYIGLSGEYFAAPEGALKDSILTLSGRVVRALHIWEDHKASGQLRIARETALELVAAIQAYEAIETRIEDANREDLTQ